MPLWLGLTGVAALLGPLLGLLVFVRRRKARAQRLLRTREPLSPQKFGAQFFGSDPRKAELASGLREVLQRHLPFDIRGLRPEDRPFDDLWLHQWDHQAAGRLIEDVVDEYGVQLGPDGLGPGRTFADLVDSLESCLYEKAAQLSQSRDLVER